MFNNKELRSSNVEMILFDTALTYMRDYYTIIVGIIAEISNYCTKLECICQLIIYTSNNS